jgi:hypothetical protein
VLGFDVEHGLPGELLIKRGQHSLRAENQIGGIFHLHQTPIVGLPDHIQHRTALRRVTVEDSVQILWRECIGQGLCAVPIGDPKALSAMAKWLPASVCWHASQLWPLQ